MSRDGWAALPRGATGLSAVCDCGISWSYSFTIKYKDLFWYYIVSSEINQNIAVEGLNASCVSFPWTCFRCIDVHEILWHYKYFCKVHSCTDNCRDFHLRYYNVPWTFWNKEQRFASLITVENRQLSAGPLNFDCSHVWQWTVNSTTVAFGSESVNMYLHKKKTITTLYYFLGELANVKLKNLITTHSEHFLTHWWLPRCVMVAGEASPQHSLFLYTVHESPFEPAHRRFSIVFYLPLHKFWEKWVWKF